MYIKNNLAPLSNFLILFHIHTLSLTHAYSLSLSLEPSCITCMDGAVCLGNIECCVCLHSCSRRGTQTLRRNAEFLRKAQREDAVACRWTGNVKSTTKCVTTGMQMLSEVRMLQGSAVDPCRPSGCLHAIENLEPAFLLLTSLLIGIPCHDSIVAALHCGTKVAWHVCCSTALLMAELMGERA